MMMTPETETEVNLGKLLFYAYRRRVDEFEVCLAKFGAEGGFNLNALNGCRDTAPFWTDAIPRGGPRGSGVGRNLGCNEPPG